MKKWNETCAISNLPILEGDTVAAVILKNKRYFHDENAFQNPDTYFCPVGFPVVGTYDGHGNLTDIVTHPWNRIIPFVRQNLSGQETAFSDHVIFMRYDAYNLVTFATANRLTNTGELYVDYLQKKFSRFFSEAFNALDSPSKFAQIMSCNPFRLGTEYDEESSSILLDKYLKSNDPDEHASAEKQLLQMHLLYTALRILRKGYGTISGTGSESADTELIGLVAKYTLEKAKDITWNIRHKADDESCFTNNELYREKISVSEE